MFVHMRFSKLHNIVSIISILVQYHLRYTPITCGWLTCRASFPFRDHRALHGSQCIAVRTLLHLFTLGPNVFDYYIKAFSKGYISIIIIIAIIIIILIIIYIPQASSFARKDTGRV